MIAGFFESIEAACVGNWYCQFKWNPTYVVPSGGSTRANFEFNAWHSGAAADMTMGCDTLALDKASDFTASV